MTWLYTTVTSILKSQTLDPEFWPSVWTVGRSGCVAFYPPRRSLAGELLQETMPTGVSENTRTPASLGCSHITNMNSAQSLSKCSPPGTDAVAAKLSPDALF